MDRLFNKYSPTPPFCHHISLTFKHDLLLDLHDTNSGVSVIVINTKGLQSLIDICYMYSQK